MNGRGRLPELDSLRGIAAAAVVLFHYTTGYDNLVGHRAPGVLFRFDAGVFGVELFFIISGFVIFMSLERTPTRYVFAVARFARLYPTYIVCGILSLITTHVMHYRGVAISWSLIAANLTMMPALFGMDTIDPSYWTLLYEVSFYVLTAIVFIGPQRRNTEKFCFLWLALAFLLQFGRSIGIAPGLLMHVEMLTAAPFAALFVIGIALYRIHSAGMSRWTGLLLVAGFAASLLAPAWANRPAPVPVYALIVGFLAGVVWLAAEGRLPTLKAAPLQWLGRISYPLYILHQMAGLAVIRRLEIAGINPDLAVTITICLALIAASAVSYYIEWPAQRWLRVRLARNHGPLVQSVA